VSDTAKLVFNGIDADYTNKTYPDNYGLTDINGDAIPLSTSAYTRQAILAPFTHRSETAATTSIDVTNKIFDVTGATNPTDAFAHTPLATNMDDGVIAVEMEITAVDASQVNGYFLELESPNFNQTIRVIGSGLDLILEVDNDGSVTSSTIETNYVPNNGDRLSILLDSTLSAGTVQGFLYDGAVKASGVLTYEDTLDYQNFMTKMGVNDLAVGESSQITSKLQVADMHASLKAVYPAGTKDLEGGTI
jgi:hypothetical protein